MQELFDDMKRLVDQLREGLRSDAEKEFRQRTKFMSDPEMIAGVQRDITRSYQQAHDQLVAPLLRLAELLPPPPIVIDRTAAEAEIADAIRAAEQRGMERAREGQK